MVVAMEERIDLLEGERWVLEQTRLEGEQRSC